MKDLELVFSNCKIYNDKGSPVYTMCEQVKKVYKDQAKALKMDQYLMRQRSNN